MRNIKLTIEYDGRGFGGWQKQPRKTQYSRGNRKCNKNNNKRRSRIKCFSEEQIAGVHALRSSCKFQNRKQA